MTQVPQPLLSVDEYLTGELTSEVRHEYVAGVAHAMVAASRRHNLIAGSLFEHFRAATRGGPCQVFMSDLKVRVPTADALVSPNHHPGVRGLRGPERGLTRRPGGAGRGPGVTGGKRASRAGIRNIPWVPRRGFDNPAGKHGGQLDPALRAEGEAVCSATGMGYYLKDQTVTVTRPES